MPPAAITELKIFIGAVLTVAVAAQVVVLPMLVSESAASFPEVAYLRTPLTTLAVVAIACGEAALLCIWRLLTLTGRGAFLTSRTTRWVDALILSLVAGTGMLAAISTVLTADPQTGGGGPAVGLGLVAGMFLGAAAILGVLVWRGQLLRRVRDAAKQQRRAHL